ncbi:MAG: hypothetical protein ACOY4R_12080 [Pseudomonadota bacterium]
MEKATGAARVVGEAIGERVEHLAERSREAGADAVAGLGRTAAGIADSVAEQSPAVADYVRGAAERVDRLADELREKKVGELVGAAMEYGRAQPLVMLAGATLVGFALSRIVKAGIEAPEGRGANRRSSHRSSHGRQPGGSSSSSEGPGDLQRGDLHRGERQATGSEADGPKAEGQQAYGQPVEERPSHDR